MRTRKEVEKEIQEVKDRLESLYEELRSSSSLEKTSKENYYQRQKQFLEESSKQLESLLQVGDFVKVIGSRASPFRKIVKITPGRTYQYSKGDRWYCGEIAGAVCSTNRKTGKFEVDDVNIISCGTNKIVKILKNETWISIKDFLSNTHAKSK